MAGDLYLTETGNTGRNMLLCSYCHIYCLIDNPQGVTGKGIGIYGYLFYKQAATANRLIIGFLGAAGDTETSYLIVPFIVHLGL